MSSRIPQALLLAAAIPAAWFGYGAWLEASIPRVEIREVTPDPAQATARLLPFFELMSPLPANGAEALPKLDYKKGPPDRFLERISVLFAGSSERIVYHGRRSRTDFPGIALLPEEPAREAHYVELAIRVSQGESSPVLTGVSGFLYRPFLLREARALLDGVATVTIMDQAGTPAFLFESARQGQSRARATALFSRRNAFYRVDYLSSNGFSLLDPEALFRRTFLTERRADALGFLAHELSEVKLDSSQKENLSLREVAWPVLLLAANLSVDPASLDSFFHFAGLNAVLYRSTAKDANLEVSDTLRNNVLSADHYAQDIAPEAAKTAEIARFARLLTRNFEQ